MLIIGGAGTIFGALLVSGGQRLIARNSGTVVFDPILISSPGESGFLSIGEVNNILFGLCIVLFLLFEPHGVAALWLRFRTWIGTWPFPY